MYSVTYVGALSMLLSFLAKVFGVPGVSDETIGATVEGVLAIAGFLATCYGRWRIGDVKWFGARK